MNTNSNDYEGRQEMLPLTIKTKLFTLRFWEACLRLLWGAARWVAVFLLLLLLACLFDWLVDRFYPTPWAVRVLMFGGQIAVGLAVIFFFILRPLFGKLSDNDMALLVEEKQPQLNHRLISVVQFNQPAARTAGMSTQLIGKVTEETVEQTKGMSFARAADHRRIGWALALVVPALIVAGVPLLLWPELMNVLLSRQLLADVEIPRSIYIADAGNPTVLPKGEEIVLRFRVRGTGVAELTPESRGVLRIDPIGLPSEYYTIKPEGKPQGEETMFTTTLPPGYANFYYRAWLLDGRSDEALHMRLVPRPVVEQIRAWVQLPKFCGTRPSGLPYEMEQPRGEAVAIADSKLKVRIQIQKPVKNATLHVLGLTSPLQNPLLVASVAGGSGIAALAGPAPLGPSLAARLRPVDATAPGSAAFETVIDEVVMKLSKDMSTAETIVPLSQRITGYRLIVADEYGFKNIPAPRRSIRVVAEDPPQVALLPEQFPPDDPFGEQLKSLDDYYVDGAPVPVGSRFRVAYTCSGPFGLGMARLQYRIFKKGDDANMSATEIKEPRWLVLPLKEVTATKKTGAFDLRRGAFENSPNDAQIDFYAIPSIRPEVELGRTQGGGRLDVNLKRLLDDTGEFYNPQPGDQVEYFIEVFADKDVAANRPVARSEVRLKSIVTPLEAVQWVANALQEESRVRQLEKKQKGVFSSN